MNGYGPQILAFVSSSLLGTVKKCIYAPHFLFSIKWITSFVLLSHLYSKATNVKNTQITPF